MSSNNYIHIHQSEGVTFDDIIKMNEELASNGVDELWSGYSTVEGHSDWTGGLFRLNSGGEVEVAEIEEDREFDGYGSTCIVWGCFGNDCFDIIAKHMTAGKLVIRYEIEGWPDEYFVMTPKSAVKTKVKF